MSNLGLYQWFTTAAKKMGGPGKFIGIFIGGGALVGSAIGSVVTNKIETLRIRKTENSGEIFCDQRCRK